MTDPLLEALHAFLKTGVPASGDRAAARKRAEVQKRYGRVDAIARTLAGYGWPEPVRGDSGNGGHLVYAIDLPACDGGLVKRVLEGLAFVFDDECVKIDTGVYNPARITRLYGTTNRKGDDVPHLDMPHREARLLSAPEHLEPVPHELLTMVASLRPEVPTP